MIRSMFLAAAVSLALAGAALAGPINPVTNAHLDRAGIEAAFPNLTPAQVDEALFDIGDFKSIQSLGATKAYQVNAYNLLTLDRAAVSARYPGLGKTELDRLMFKIADINSLSTL